MKSLGLIFCFNLIALSWAGSVIESPSDSQIRYDDFSVYKIRLNNIKEKSLLQNLMKDRENFKLWYEDGQELHLMISPKEKPFFENITRVYNIDTDIWIANVQSLIEAETHIESKADENSFSFTRYHNLDEIYKCMDEIIATYSEAENFIIGQSYEKRNIRGIKISYKPNNPGIFIESNIHAREWITSATAIWFINELLTSTNPQVRELAENNDWYIIPVLNVDGFVYSHQRDRLWRKTRQPSQDSPCIGADPNRNYGSHWMESGASDNPCDETYAGPYAYSEPEILAMQNYFRMKRDQIGLVLAFHSYSQLLLSPYGYTKTETPQNHADLLSVARAYANAVKKLQYKTDYKYGATAGTLYPASGATNDWAYLEHGIKLSYTIEFRDQGRYGFVLPPSHIIPNCEETLAGMIALVNQAKALGYLASSPNNQTDRILSSGIIS